MDDDQFEKFERLRRLEAEIEEEPEVREHPRSCYEEAMLKLSETAIPKNIPCRSNEKEVVREFLMDGIRRLGTNQTLYLSGVPGIGKTLTVNEVVENLKNESCWKNVKFISLNATKLPKPQTIYLSLFKELTGQTLSNVSKAMQYLDEIFTKGILPVKMTASKAKERELKERISLIKVIFIDELDYLYTKNEDVLYNLFEWTQKHPSKIVMVTISNTIDFPERLEEKIMSRVGNSRLVFHPYTAKEIQIIIKDRIEATGVFDPYAVEYACKKVANSSPDIRKCLQIMRDALSLFMKEKPPSGKVEMDHVERAHHNLYSNSAMNHFKNAPTTWKIILMTVCDRIRVTGTSCLYSELDYELRHTKNMHLFSRVMHVLNQLRDLNILSIREVKRIKDNRIDKSIPIPNNVYDYVIELTVGLDQILYPLKDEVIPRRLPD